MTDLTNKTNDELAAIGAAFFQEAEARFAAHGGFPRAHRRIKTSHACADDAMQDIVSGGIVQPMSVGGDKT